MNEYYTVSEFSKIVGKDEGNIRRLLARGDIAGEKRGCQWFIPHGTTYPRAKRISTGQYRNWRKKDGLSRKNPRLLDTLKTMCVKLSQIYGDSMNQAVLYGSYARGDETSESDIDIALFLKNTESEEMHDRMIDLVVDYELELSITLSVVPLDFSEYLQCKDTLPFYKNIENEGIILWKTA